MHFFFIPFGLRDSCCAQTFNAYLQSTARGAQTEHKIIRQAQIFPLPAEWHLRRIKTGAQFPAVVPGCVHLDLLRAGAIPDPFYRTHERDVQWIEAEDWEYTGAFRCDAELLEHENIELVFEGLDTYADVYLNGELLLETDNMFVARHAEIKSRLRAGENQLHVYFHSPIKRALPRYLATPFKYPAINDQAEQQVSIFTRKAPYHYGWDWGPRMVTSGIWRAIKLRAWNTARIAVLQIRQLELDATRAQLSIECEIEATRAGAAELKIEIIGDAEEICATASCAFEITVGAQSIALPLEIAQPRRWFPHGLGEPFLYQLRCRLETTDGRDVVTESLGLRTVEVVNQPDADGESFYLKINGTPVFMKGANYIPPDSFNTRADQKTYTQLFDAMTAAHFNMLRVWGGGVYESDEFYTEASRRGILIWQDFMFACSMYPADSEFLDNIRRETEYNIKRLRNQACLALWCGNNEIAQAWQHWGWRQNLDAEHIAQMTAEYDLIFHELLPSIVTEHDAERFYLPSSPISNWAKQEDFTRGDNHFWGVWHGEYPFEDYNKFVPRFMSEYGFQSFPELATMERFALPEDYDLNSDVLRGHQKNYKGNGLIKRYLREWYRPPKNFAQFLYVGQLLQAEAMKIAIEAHRRNMPFCMGTLYWQLNDCWPGASWSSVDYYGRWKAAHYFIRRAYQPLLVAPISQGGHLTVHIVSDDSREKQARAVFTLMKFDGRILSQIEQQLTIAPNASELIYEADTPQFGADFDPHNTLFQVALYDPANEDLLAENHCYFGHPVIFDLPVPHLRFTVEAAPDGAIIQLTTEKLAKNIYLTLPADATAHFEDNFFDLLPNAQTCVKVGSALPFETIADDLQMQTLRDSFFM